MALFEEAVKGDGAVAGLDMIPRVVDLLCDPSARCKTARRGVTGRRGEDAPSRDWQASAGPRCVYEKMAMRVGRR